MFENVHRVRSVDGRRLSVKGHWKLVKRENFGRNNDRREMKKKTNFLKFGKSNKKVSVTTKSGLIYLAKFERTAIDRPFT